jgi:hypothetical protein
MMDLFSTLFTGILSGGATGLLGLLLQRWFDAKKAQQDIQLVKLQLDAAAASRQMELAAQERMASKAADVQLAQAQLDAQAREVEAAERSYVASTQTDRATYSTPEAQQQSRVVRWMMGLADLVRGLVRPSITGYTLWMLTAVFLWVRELYSQTGLQLTPEQVHDLAMQCVGTVFYLATTCVVWWFGVRPGQPPKR